MLLTASPTASGKGSPGPLRSRPVSNVLHDCSLMTMSMQDNPRELSLPMESSVYGYCGVCADHYPNENFTALWRPRADGWRCVNEMPFKEMLFFEFSGSLQDQVVAGNPALKAKMSKVGRFGRSCGTHLGRRPKRCSKSCETGNRSSREKKSRNLRGMSWVYDGPIRHQIT